MNNPLERAKKLHQLFVDGKIPTLAQHEVHPDIDRSSRENYLYFTLPPCINFQRSSPAMWKSALETWNDTATHYLFFPEQVIEHTRNQVQADLIKHGLGLQKNTHTNIWIAISTTLHRFFENDPRKLLASVDFDVPRILKLIQQEKKEHFTHLRGPKMSNYWLMILSQYTDVQLKNMEEISIIPDTHVQQCSVNLGVVKEGAEPVEVAQAWKILLAGSGIMPVQMHPVLWNWSRNSFEPAV